MGNAVLQGFLLLENRKRQIQQDKQAEEQREIENIQAKEAQSLAEKEQKRRQKVTDQQTQVVQRKFDLDTAIERLQFEEGQALGRTPSEATFQLPEVSEEFTGPREGGIIGRQDTSGLAGPFGAPSFQPEDRQNELIQAFVINQQLQAMQQREKALASPTVLAGQLHNINARDLLDLKEKQGIRKEKRAFEDKKLMLGLSEESKARLLGIRESLRSKQRLEGDELSAEMAGINAGMGNGDLPGGRLKLQLLPALRSGMIKEGLNLGFTQDQLDKIRWVEIKEKKKERIIQFMPLILALRDMKTAVLDGMKAGMFPNSLLKGQAIKSIEDIKAIFGQSKFTIELERHLADAVSFARSTGETGRFSDQDMLASLGRMIRAGLLDTEAQARVDLFENRARGLMDFELRGIDPIQQEIAFGDIINSALGRNVGIKEGTKTTRTLEADPSTRGTNERAVKDTEGNLLWFDTKTGKRRERSK